MDMMTDLYPSRLAPQPELRTRHDPVVYGAAAGGPLASATLAEYERNGYLAFDRLLPATEIGALRAELDRMWAWAADADDETIVREPSSREVRSVFAIHRGDGPFARLAADPRLVRMAEQILGGPVYVHQSRVNFKPGFTGKEFYWHSDFETWHVEDGMPRMRALQLSIALTENLPHNGPLMLVPGLAPPLRRLRRRDAGRPLQGLAAETGIRRARRRKPAHSWSRKAASSPRPGRPARQPCSTATRCTARTATSRRCRAATSSSSTTAWKTPWSPRSAAAPHGRSSWPPAR